RWPSQKACMALSSWFMRISWIKGASVWSAKLNVRRCVWWSAYGDMVGGLLREGNAGPAENADTWIPHLVQRLMEGTNRDVDQFRVRLDGDIVGCCVWRTEGRVAYPVD
ncbi:hypothetical protein, partial [Halomonas llamarensis]